MNSPAPGSRIRSIRAFDKGVARCRTFAVGAPSRVYRLAGCWLRQPVDRYSHLRSDRGALGASAPFPKDLIRLGPLDYSGLRGEGSIPVPLPPPLIPATGFLHQ
jgi:hypothetical protein